MKVFITFCLLLTLCGTINAQPELLWTRLYGGNENEQGLGLFQTADNGFALIGNEGSFDGGGTDGWLIITDPDGDEIWSVNDGGAGYDRFYDGFEVDDGYIMAGYTGSFGAGNFDYWLVKYNRDGDLMWSQAYGGRDHERGTKVIRVPGGGYAMIGTTFSFGNGEADGWVVVTDDEGNQIWEAAYGGNAAESLQGIFPVGENDFILIGYTASEGEGGSDVWMLRISGENEGEVIWSHTYGGEDDDIVYRAIRNDDGDFMLVGVTNRIDGQNNDFYLLKINDQGEEIWSRVYEGEGSERAFAVVQTADGGYMLAGNTWPYDDNRADVILLRTDPDGEMLWSATYGGEQSDVCRAMIGTNDQGFALYGWTSSFADSWMSYLLRFGGEFFGEIQCLVTDAANAQPLEGVEITTSLGQIAQTDAEGRCRIEFALLGEFSITAVLPGYNAMVQEGLEIGADEVMQLEFALTHPEFVPSIDEVDEFLGFDESVEIHFSVLNSGNGPLEWSVRKELRGEANVDPWGLRTSLDAGLTVEDTKIQGVVFINDLYYVAGEGDDNPLIYVFNLNGELVESFEQPMEDDRGFKDMAYDGELIWGTARSVVYGISLDGELIHSFEAPYNPTSSVAWDSQRECLWLAGTTSDPVAYDREGNAIEGLQINRQDLRIYGLAFMEGDPDQSQLYIFNKDRETNNQTIHKVNIETNEMTFVSFLFPEAGGSPGGAYITNTIDYLSWVLITTANNSPNDGGDRVDIWQIEGNTGWLDIEPAAAVLEANEEQDFMLTLNTVDLIPMEYPGNLVFSHNAAGGETNIPVTLTLQEGPHQAQQMLNLELGWNMVSAYLQPDVEDIVELTSGLVEVDALLMVKDGEGRFYSPEFGFNNIPRWDVAQGYLIKMSEAGELLLDGMTVEPDDPIALTEGWQMVSYYLRQGVDAVIALSGLGDNLLMAKDGNGRFYNTEFGFSNMGDLMPGMGYLMKLAQDDELIYVARLEEEIQGSGGNSSTSQLPAYFPVHENTGQNMSLLLKTPGLSVGEIGVFAGDVLIGSGVIGHEITGLAIWGDDTSTPEMDGALPGQEMHMVLYNGREVVDFEYSLIAGVLVYTPDSFTAMEAHLKVAIPEEFEISSVYPNPFNSSATITYRLAEFGTVQLKVYDINGSEVFSSDPQSLSPGEHSATINGNLLSSGVYIAKISTGTEVRHTKVTLIR